MSHTIAPDQVFEGKKLQELVEKLTAKGVRFEIEHREVNRETMIGITNGKHVWHWFSHYIFADGYEYLSFSHSYSQNNGQTYKGTCHRIQVREALEKKLDFKFF